MESVVSPMFIYVAAAGLVVLVLIVLTLMRKPQANAQNEGEIHGPPRQLPRNVGNVPPRARRRRMDRRAAQDESDEDPLDGDDILESAPIDERWGAKKQKKMQEKEERRAMRLQEEQERKDKKRRDAEMELLRKKEEAKEKAEEAIQEEEERVRKEEQERREHEEYLKLKEAFSVEDEGEDEGETDLTSQTLLIQFINYIKDMKVVMLEDLAAHFKIKTQDAIDRIQDLQTEGRLTGVIDDRGKFIYITIEELEAVAKFIKQHGRVSISELAESSNRLINLTPDNTDTHKKLLSDVSV